MLNLLKRILKRNKPEPEPEPALVIDDSTTVITLPEDGGLVRTGFASFLPPPTKMKIDAPEDDKGGFFADMTEDEVLQYERDERLGWKNFKVPWKE